MISSKTYKDLQPEEKVKEAEIHNEILQFKTLLSLMYGKPINPVLMITTLLEEPILIKFAKEKFQMKETMEIFQHILLTFPKLLKSKIVKTAIQDAIKDGKF